MTIGAYRAESMSKRGCDDEANSYEVSQAKESVCRHECRELEVDEVGRHTTQPLVACRIGEPGNKRGGCCVDQRVLQTDLPLEVEGHVTVVPELVVTIRHHAGEVVDRGADDLVGEEAHR